jgi:nitroreductase
MAFDWAKEGNSSYLTEMAERGANLITCGAPCLIFCHSPEDYANCVLDPAIAMETVELLLANRGLSTCWAGILLRLSNQVPAICETLQLPEGNKVRCALMVGYADGENYPNIPYRPKAQPMWLE